MSSWTFEIGGLTVGAGTGYYVLDFAGETELAVKDATRSGADGTRFGRDTRAGSTYTFEFRIHGTSPENCLDMADALRARWRGDAVRQSPGVVTELRVIRPGRDSVVFGRPRKFAVTDVENVGAGHVDAQAEFQASDDLFYSYTETVVPIALRPANVGGFVVPATAPWGAANAAPPSENSVTVGGSLPTWLVVDIHGPVSSPVIEVVDHYTISMPGVNIPDNQTLTIDPRPWARSVKTNEGANKAGAFASTSPKLDDLKIEPGTHIVKLSGTDSTGTAYIDVRFRNANAGF